MNLILIKSYIHPATSYFNPYYLLFKVKESKEVKEGDVPGEKQTLSEEPEKGKVSSMDR